MAMARVERPGFHGASIAIAAIRTFDLIASVYASLVRNGDLERDFQESYFYSVYRNETGLHSDSFADGVRVHIRSVP